VIIRLFNNLCVLALEAVCTITSAPRHAFPAPGGTGCFRLLVGQCIRIEQAANHLLVLRAMPFRFMLEELDAFLALGNRDFYGILPEHKFFRCAKEIRHNLYRAEVLVSVFDFRAHRLLTLTPVACSDNPDNSTAVCKSDSQYAFPGLARTVIAFFTAAVGQVFRNNATRTCMVTNRWEKGTFRFFEKPECPLFLFRRRFSSPPRNR
jgi:hypothetical protein